MAVKFANLASSTLASSLSNTATSISVTSSSSFPTLGSGDYFYASIGETSGSEIVKVTGVSSNTFTVVRGQDGTSAQNWSSGSTIALRVVAAALDDIAEQAQTAADTESVSIDGDTMTGDLTINSTTLKIAGDFPRIYLEDTAGSDQDAYIANNANGLFFGKTNSPSASNDILTLNLSNSSATFAGTISSGAITSSGNITGAALIIDGNTAVDKSGSNYMVFYDGSGAPALYAGNTSDNRNYYQSAHHRFRSDDGSTNFAELSSAGLRIGGTSTPAEKLHVESGNIRADGAFIVNGTTVIDSSRNLTAIATISSGSISTSGTITGSYSANNGYVHKLTNTNTGTSAYTEFTVESGSQELRIGTSQNYASGQWDGSWVYAAAGDLFLKSGLGHVKIYAGDTVTPNWTFNTDGSIRRGDYNGTTFVDLSRNITAGTISSGAITATGNLSLSGDSRKIEMLDGTTNSQPSIAIGEQSNWGVRQRWDSGQKVIFEGWWNTATSGAVNRDFGHLDAYSNKWRFNDYVGINVDANTTYRLYVNGNIRADGAYYVGGSAVIDSSRNLTNVVNATITGTATIPYVRVTGTGDASLSSTTHGIQVGETSGQNLLLDNNEVLSRNNGAASYLHLQADGGTVTVGAGTTANLTVSGTISSGAITSSGHITMTSNGHSVNTRSVLARDTNGLNLGSTNGTTAISIDNSSNVSMPYNLTVTGNLTVSGTTTTIDTANLNVEDNNITLNYSTGDSSASANGAGITIQDAVNSTTDATLTWDATNDEWDFSHGASINGHLLVSSLGAFGNSTLDPDAYGSYAGGFGTIADGSGWVARGLFVHGGGTGDAAAIAHNGSNLYFGIQNGSSDNSMGSWLTVNPTKVANFAAQVNVSGHGNSSQWNTAYGWGNHANAGYNNASNLSSGTLPSARLSGTYSEALTFSSTALRLKGHMFFDEFSSGRHYVHFATNNSTNQVDWRIQTSGSNTTIHSWYHNLAHFRTPVKITGNIDSDINGNNTSGGNIRLGATGNNAAKWFSISGRQYASSTETEGYSLITGSVGSGENNVVVGGGLDEQNAATGVFIKVAANTSTRNGTEVVRVTTSGFDVRNNVLRMTGTTVIDSSRNLTSLKSIELENNVPSTTDNKIYRDGEALKWQGGEFEAYVTHTVDMTNTSTYSESNYYPVTITGIGNGRSTRLRVEVHLNSGSTPSWDTHSSGFSILLDWVTNGSGWGTTYVTRQINAYTERWASSTICGGITSMDNSSTEVVWLRGGGKYFIKTDRHGLSVTPRSSTYTTNSQSISPSSTAQNNVWDSANNGFGAGKLYSKGNINITSGVFSMGGATVIDSAKNVIATSFRPSVDNRWKIRGNSGNANLAFEYSTSSGLSDSNIKFELTPSRAELNGDFVFTKSPDPRIYAGTNVGLNIDGQALYLNRNSNSNILVGSGSAPATLSGLNVHMNGSSYVLASDGTRSAFMGADSSGYAMFGSLTNHDVVIRTNNTERIRVATNGNVTFKGDTFSFHGSGTDTYTSTALYINQTYGVLLEGSLQSNASGGVKNPLVFTWRGNWNTQGGIKVEAGKTTVDSLHIKSGNSSVAVINSAMSINNVTLGALATGARFEANNWHQDSSGYNRFYFEGAGRTFFRTGSAYVFRDNGDTGRATISADGGLNLRSGGDGLVGSTVALAVSGTTSIDSSRNVFGVNGSFTGKVDIGAGTIGTRSTSLSVYNSDDSSPIAVRANKTTVFAVLPWSNAVTYLSSGTYYDDGAWIHASDTEYNALFAFSGGTGGFWYASSGSTANWNIASDVQLWNNTGQWTSSVNTLSSVQAGFYKVGSTTIIDASRNIANAGTITAGLTKLTPSGYSTAPQGLAALNIGRAGSGETRAIDIWGSWSNGESKSITFNHGGSSTQMVAQINVAHKPSTNTLGSSIRWGKLYHGTDSSTYTMELHSESTTLANLYINAGMVQIGHDGSYSNYGVIGFGGRSNGSNRIFADTGNSDGMYINAATGRGIFFRVNGNGSNVFQIKSDGGLYVGASAGTLVLDQSRNLTNIGTISSGGITALTANGSTTLPNVVLTIQANTASTITTGGGTAIKFKGVSSGGNIQNYDQAMIASVGQSTNNSHGLDFYYKPNGSTALTKALSIIPDGTTVARINLISHGYISATGLVNGASYQVGGTTVIDSSRNITTTGNIARTGTEGREIQTYMASSYTTNDIVAGHEYGWYNDYWRIGISRSGNTAGEAFRFNYSGSYVAQIGTTGIFDGTGYRISSTTVIDASRNGVFERLRADGGNLIMGDEAYSASTGYVGMKTSYMSGSNDYMIISGLSDGNTYVSAKDGAAVNIRGGANNSNNQLVVPDGTYISVMTSNLNCTGNVTAYYSSDESLKTNIRVIDSPLERIKKIRGVFFDWTDAYIKEQSGDGKIHVRKDDVGVIAQDVQPVLDEVVTTREDGTLAVRYEKMIALCIEAIKDQQDQIDSLKQIIEEMKNGDN